MRLRSDQAIIKEAIASATQLDAPKADLVYILNLSAGYAVDVPGYSGEVSLALSISNSWKDNGLSSSACQGIGGMINLSSSNNWRGLLVSIPSVKPDISVGVSYGEPQQSIVGVQESNESSIPFFSGSLSDDFSKPWSINFSPGNFVFGVRSKECLTFTLTARTIENELDNFMEEGERIYEEFLDEVSRGEYSRSSPREGRNF